MRPERERRVAPPAWRRAAARRDCLAALRLELDRAFSEAGTSLARRAGPRQNVCFDQFRLVALSVLVEPNSVEPLLQYGGRTDGVIGPDFSLYAQSGALPPHRDAAGRNPAAGNQTIHHPQPLLHTSSVGVSVLGLPAGADQCAA